MIIQNKNNILIQMSFYNLLKKIQLKIIIKKKNKLNQLYMIKINKKIEKYYLIKILLIKTKNKIKKKVKKNYYLIDNIYYEFI